MPTCALRQRTAHATYSTSRVLAFYIEFWKRCFLEKNQNAIKNTSFWTSLDNPDPAQAKMLSSPSPDPKKIIYCNPAGSNSKNLDAEQHWYVVRTSPARCKIKQMLSRRHFFGNVSVCVVWILDFLNPDSCCLQQDQVWDFLCYSRIRIGFGFRFCWKNVIGCLFDLH